MNSTAKGHIHFIGIGGSSMSGLAEIALKQGFTVSGSDRSDSDKIKGLKEKGITVFPFHSAENITDDISLVVYTLAVSPDNPELIEAKNKNISIMERGVYLGQICSHYKYSVAVAGTHGKTSTTSMLSSILLSADLNPAIHIGGIFPRIGSNVLASTGDYFVTEACEYHANFLNLRPFGEIILNIEAEHLDFYKDINHIMDCFSEFATYCPPDGFIVVCADDNNALKAVKTAKAEIFSYSVKDTSATYSAINISQHGSNSSYTLCYNAIPVIDINLNVPGMHNISNSLAAAAAAFQLGCTKESIKDGLEAFTGTGRRFEKKGEYNGASVIDDYAHHPTEIRATLSAARAVAKSNKIYAIFQPHTYSRAIAFLNDFSDAFKEADNVVVTDIFSAREKDPGTISGKSIAEVFVNNGIEAVHISDFSEIASQMRQKAKTGDIIITIGAGDVNKIIPEILIG
ncbi:MAG: UDP-N-acetylmuramate--L-alanine ligase [Clostridia bacterium]|nr:UDP-N-acetylmuramate--L-alanine ligase [Clostridia bacterium]